MQEISKNLLLHEAIKSNTSGDLLRLLLSYVPESRNNDVLYLQDEFGNTALHQAVESRSLACLVVILDRRHDTLRNRNKDGLNVIHLIVKKKYVEGCKKVAELCDQTYFKELSVKHYTAVHMAAGDGSKEILMILLSKASNERSTSKKRHTPLHKAMESGSTDCVTLMLENVPLEVRKDYINAKTSDGTTALMVAAQKGFVKCAQLLKEADVNLVNKDGFSALHLAAKKGFTRFVKYLIDIDADTSLKTNKSEHTALYYACSAGVAECLKSVLEKTVEINNPQYLLKATIAKNHTACLDVLLAREDIKKCIDHQFPENGNDTLLHISLKKGSYKITRELLKNGANKYCINDRMEYPLHLALAQKPLEERSAEEERLEDCKNIMQQCHNYVNETNR